MSQTLAVAKSPVFASFRAKGSRSSARPPEVEGTVVEHRLDLLMDRLEQLEFTFQRLFDTDIDGHEDDRLAQIETRLQAMHDQLTTLAESRRAAAEMDARLDAMQDMLGALAGGESAIDALAEDMGTRHDALLDTLASLATSDEQDSNTLTQLATDQQTRFDTLHAMLANVAERAAPDAKGDDAVLQAIADLSARQAAAQAQAAARAPALSETLVEDAFDALTFRVSRLVDARMAAGFAGLADALDRASEALCRAQPARAASADATETINGAEADAGDPRAVIEDLARACRSASADDRNGAS